MSAAARVPVRHAARARSRGFTLLEILVAISLMAILAVLSWRGLDAVLATRERLGAAANDVRALSVTFSQIEDDLLRSWSVRLTNPPIPTVGFVIDGSETWPAMQLLRELPAGSRLGQFQRVIYRLRDGQFERGFIPWFSGAAQVASSSSSAAGLSSTDPTTAQSATTVTWQPLLARVSGIRYRAWIDGQGWVPSNALLYGAGTVPGVSGRVTGIEITLERTGGERYLRILTVKD